MTTFRCAFSVAAAERALPPQSRHVVTAVQSASLCQVQRTRSGIAGNPGSQAIRDQRAAGGGGNGDAAGAAAAAGFGFFGLAGRRTCFGGGPAGLSSATTGLGSMVVDAGESNSPGTLMTCTGTVTGWNLFMV